MFSGTKSWIWDVQKLVSVAIIPTADVQQDTAQVVISPPPVETAVAAPETKEHTYDENTSLNSEPDQIAHNAENTTKTTTSQTAVFATAIPTANAKKQSPFESMIVDGESELLAGVAEGWDLLRDLPGDRFLIRRKVARPLQ